MTERIDVYDYSEEGEALRQRVWQRRRRVCIPVLGVAAIIAALLAVTLYSYRSNRDGALALSEDLLTNLDRRIHTEVQAYLRPAASAARIVAGLLQHERYATLRQKRDVAEPLALEILETLPNLATVSFGGPEGDFLMLRRSLSGAIDSKLIRHAETGTRTFWVRRNLEGEETAVEEVPNDGYDPRARPWYQGAVEHNGLYWTGIYVFFTDRRPGVTVSIPILSSDGRFDGVLGLDLALDDLGIFLRQLEIGRSGKAMIIDAAGYLVAYPNLDEMLRQEGDELVTASLDELGDPVLTRALNRFRVEGHGRRIIEVEGKRYISTVSSLDDVVARDWSVVIVVPENDFVGFVARNNETVLLMSLSVVLLATLMATLLVRQGLKADHDARRVLLRQHAIQRQGKAFAEIAAVAAQTEMDLDSARAQATEQIANAAGVRRVSLWRIMPGERLRCTDAYDKESQGHTRDMELLAADLPQLYSALCNGSPLVKTEAAADPDTTLLHQRYLSPLGCNSLISVPLGPEGNLIGFLWLEDNALDQVRAQELVDFAQTIANLISVVVQARSPDVSGTMPDADAPAPAMYRGAAASRGKMAPGLDAEMTAHQALARPLVDRLSERAQGGSLAAEVFQSASVMVLEFADAVVLAERSGGEDSGAVRSRRNFRRRR